MRTLAPVPNARSRTISKGFHSVPNVRSPAKKSAAQQQSPADRRELIVHSFWLYPAEGTVCPCLYHLVQPMWETATSTGPAETSKTPSNVIHFDHAQVLARNVSRIRVPRAAYTACQSLTAATSAAVGSTYRIRSVLVTMTKHTLTASHHASSLPIPCSGDTLVASPAPVQNDKSQVNRSS